jgi:hypothetical protein
MNWDVTMLPWLKEWQDLVAGPPTNGLTGQIPCSPSEPIVRNQMVSDTEYPSLMAGKHAPGRNHDRAPLHRSGGPQDANRTGELTGASTHASAPRHLRGTGLPSPVLRKEIGRAAEARSRAER